MRVIGMISGTSADAIEAVLCDIDGRPPDLRQRVLAATTTPFEPDLQRRIHAVAAGDGDAEAVCLLDVELGERFAAAALGLVSEAGLSPDEVDLIGSHGQTVWHAAREDGSVAGTLQVGSAAVIAERTGITTVSDLRSRDVAAGGQGAPLVGYVDWLLLRDEEAWRALQNMGGIGNVTLLPPRAMPERRPLAFDTGPANVLIDIVTSLVTEGRAAYDEDGRMAATGTVDEAWVATLLEHPYFGRRPPKTTGRELFGPAMGSALLAAGRARGLRDRDIVASLTAFSADSVADQYRRFLPVVPAEVVVSGGGARNPVLMARLANRLPTATRLLRLEDLGLASQQKEAVAMAVLAYEAWHGRPGTLPELTGAGRAVVLGSITPGKGALLVRGQPRTAEPDGTEGLDPRAAALDTLPTLEILRLMNGADATVADVVGAVLPELARAVDAIAERLGAGGRLVYAGAGTSGRLAKLDAVECVPTFGVPPTLVSAILAGGDAALLGSIEGAEDDTAAGRRDVARAGIGTSDVLVGIAASGTTPWVVGALLEARRRGALTVAISGNAPAPILDLADHPIAVPTGPEVLAGSTRLKAGTAQKLVLNMVSTATMVRLGKVHGNRMIDVTVTNRKLRRRAEGIVADVVGCDTAAAAALLDRAGGEAKTAVLMGLAGLDAATAREALARAGGVLRTALGESIRSSP